MDLATSCAERATSDSSCWLGGGPPRVPPRCGRSSGVDFGMQFAGLGNLCAQVLRAVPDAPLTSSTRCGAAHDLLQALLGLRMHKLYGPFHRLRGFVRPEAVLCI